MSWHLESPIMSPEFRELYNGGGVFGGPGARHELRLSRKENFIAAERFFVGGLADPLPQLPSFPLDRFHNDDGVNAELGEQQGEQPFSGLNATIRYPAAFAGRDLDETDPLEVPHPATKTALGTGRRAEPRAERTLDLSVGIACNLFPCRTRHRVNMSHPDQRASARLQ
jgi:hypothetical protein